MTIRAKDLIESVLQGTSTRLLVDNLVNGLVAPLINRNTSISCGYPSGTRCMVKTYYDSYGDLKVCTENDVIIDPASDHFVNDLVEIADLLSHDHPLQDILADYCGPLDKLHRRVTSETGWT